MGLFKVDYSALLPHLGKDEKILDSLSGHLKNTVPGNEPERQGMLAATDRRLIFQMREKKDEVISFPYSEILKVEEGGDTLVTPLSSGSGARSTRCSPPDAATSGA